MNSKIIYVSVILVVFSSVGVSPVLAQSDDGGEVTTPDGTIIDEVVEQAQENDKPDPWKSVIADSQWRNLNVYKVEYNYEKETARVYLESTERVQVTVTDGTRQETGFHNRVSTTLEPGDDGKDRKIIEIQLWKVSNEHITVEAEGQLWSHFGEGSELRTDEPVQYPIILAPVAGILTLVLVVGLHQYSGRYRNSAKNPIKG